MFGLFVCFLSAFSFAIPKKEIIEEKLPEFATVGSSWDEAKHTVISIPN